MLRVALPTLLGTFLTTAAAGQSVTLRGRVVERGTIETIAGADVQLSGLARTITTARGEFIFVRMDAGPRTLTVSLLGYQRRDIALNLRADTTLVIELEVAALQLDSLTVRAQPFTLRGQLLDRVTRSPIADGEVLVGRDRRALSNVGGRFRLAHLAAVESATVVVRALGFLPLRTTLTAVQDTTVRFELEPDLLGRRLQSQHVARLQDRMLSVGFSTRALDRDQLNQQSIVTAYDLVLQHIGIGALSRVACLFVDEHRVLGGLPQLHAYNSDQLERIEVIDSGTMIRVYTRRYVVEALRRGDQLGPILLMGRGRRMVCG